MQLTSRLRTSLLSSNARKLTQNVRLTSGQSVVPSPSRIGFAPEQGRCLSLSSRCPVAVRVFGNKFWGFNSSDELNSEPQFCCDVEQSSMVHEEIVYFIFQLELDIQLQRALNYDAYEQAQQIRAKRQQVDEALEQVLAKKNSGGGGGGASEGLSAADIAAEGLTLRTAMARAVEQEDYKEAAAIRDKLASLEALAKRTEAAASAAATSAKPGLRLGQRVWHKQYGYKAIVVGWDAKCCESEEWLEAVKQQQSKVGGGGGGVTQAQGPWYHIMVDQRDWKEDLSKAPVAYVPESLLWAPEQGGAVPAAAVGPYLAHQQEVAQEEAARTAAAQGKPAPVPVASKPAVPPPGGVDVVAGSGWVECFGSEAMQHPFLYILFLGQDGQGDYVPCRQLRDKYNVQRRDVYSPGEKDGNKNDNN